MYVRPWPKEATLSRPFVVKKESLMIPLITALAVKSADAANAASSHVLPFLCY